MRVLTVAQVGNFFEVHEDVWRKSAVVSAMRQVLRDLRIVPGSAKKRFARQIEKRFVPEQAASLGECRRNHFVVRR